LLWVAPAGDPDREARRNPHPRGSRRAACAPSTAARALPEERTGLKPQISLKSPSMRRDKRRERPGHGGRRSILQRVWATLAYRSKFWSGPALVDRVRRLPVLLVITFRPEFQPPWGRPLPTSRVLALNRLGRGARPARRAGCKLWPAIPRSATEIVAEIIERTDGVPLFVEELTKAGAGKRRAGRTGLPRCWRRHRWPAQSVPAPLHASLMARLDQLGPAGPRNRARSAQCSAANLPMN